MTALYSTKSRAWRIHWRQVLVLYSREMRAAFRERNIVVNSLLIPLLLYPFLLWVGFNSIIFVQGQTEGFRSRLLIQEWPAGHRDLQRAFEREDQVELLGSAATADPERSLADGSLDTWVEFLPAEGEGSELPGNFQVRITFNESRDRSATARDRVRRVIDRYREDWLEREAGALGLDRVRWHRFSIATENVASDRELGGFVLGQMLPLFFVVAVAIGCVYPAIDATAGERERGTWETLMSTAANRLSVATAKYLFVASLGGLAGLLNLTALALTMRPIFGPLLEQSGETIAFAVGWSAVPVIVLGAVLLGGFVAAGMLLFAAFARTFKEGQAMITPFFLVMVLPVLFLHAPGLVFSPALGCVPVINVQLMIRAALTGSTPWLPITFTVAVSLVLIAVCVLLGAFILQFEEVLMGSGGGLRAFLRRRVLGRTTARDSINRS
jgi:sodium transport system permease protein